MRSRRTGSRSIRALPPALPPAISTCARRYVESEKPRGSALAPTAQGVITTTEPLGSRSFFCLRARTSRALGRCAVWLKSFGKLKSLSTVAFSPDERVSLCYTTTDGELVRHDLDIFGLGRGTHIFEFSPDGSLLALVGGNSNDVALYDVPTATRRLIPRP